MIALQSDLHKLENQNWACFSIIKPDEYGQLSHREKTYNGYLIKFRGCFSTKEQAVSHIEKIMAVDKHFDVHLVPTFQWASMEDTEVEDREYVNDVIKDIVTGYFKKENEKFASFRDRIKNTENCERSEEASDFFQKCSMNSSADCKKEKSSEHLRSLDDIANEFDVHPNGSYRKHDEIGDECVQSIISEIILD